MANDLTIFRPENVQLLSTSAPQVLSANQTSHDRCLQAGQSLLDLIQQSGMTDVLDQQCAKYITKAKNTVRKLNEQRTPFTKLFDEIRSQFTALENEVDPAKRDTIPYRIQQFRNEYAAKLRAEEDARRRAAIIEQQRQQAIAKYRSDIEGEYQRYFNNLLNGAINKIMKLYTLIDLDNWERQQRDIEAMPDAFPTKLITCAACSTPLPVNVPADQLRQVRDNVIQCKLPLFTDTFKSHISSTKAEYLALIPSRVQELQRAAKASAEEADRICQQMAERDALEASRRQQELAEQQQRQQQQAELASQQAEVANLFGASAAAQPSATVKCSVKKLIEVSEPAGFMAILNLWWVEEGQFLTVEELAKMFKKQVSYVVKLANDKDNPRFITDNPHISYIDDVKAK